MRGVKRGGKTAGMSLMMLQVGVFVFHTWCWWITQSNWNSLLHSGVWSWTLPGLFWFFYFDAFISFLCFLLWRFDKYSVHSSVTVTIVTRYFFILHNQRCHDAGWGWAGPVGGAGWAGLGVCRWGSQCDVDQGSLLVGSAPVDSSPRLLHMCKKPLKCF